MIGSLLIRILETQNGTMLKKIINFFKRFRKKPDPPVQVRANDYGCSYNNSDIHPEFDYQYPENPKK